MSGTEPEPATWSEGLADGAATADQRALGPTTDRAALGATSERGTLVRRGGPDPEQGLERSPIAAVRRWAEGGQTLKELKGYSSEELHCISQLGYTLFLNGKIRDARIIFEGLVAVDPRNEYYYRALGVVYHREGDPERALRQFGHAITVSGRRSVAAYINRAEVHIARRDHGRAITDLEAALRLARDPRDPLARKAGALKSLLIRPRARLSPTTP